MEEGVGLLFNSSDVIFQSGFCKHNYADSGVQRIFFRGIVKDFRKSSIRKMVLAHIKEQFGETYYRDEVEKGDDYWYFEKDMNEDEDFSWRCPFAFRRFGMLLGSWKKIQILSH